MTTTPGQGKEFVRVGYYVNNEYADPALAEAPPERPQLDKLQRNIMADHPRVTKFPHDFDNPPAPPPAPVEGAEGDADDDDVMAMDDADDGAEDEEEDDDDENAGMEDDAA